MFEGIIDGLTQTISVAGFDVPVWAFVAAALMLGAFIIDIEKRRRS